MKLYTEFQVNELRRALRDIAQWDEDLEEDWEDAGNRAMDALRCFEKETPIELLSKEEIEIEALSFCNSQEISSDTSYYGFLGACQWFLRKIQGGNK